MKMRTSLASLALTVLLLMLSPATLLAQQTYFVTVAGKSAQHPSPGGWPETYLIDGTEAAELTLVRGETYVFQLQNVSSLHPFYIASQSGGGGAGVYNEGVTGNFATGSGSVTFIVPESAPDQLYYECSNHAQMGGVLNIVSSGTDVERDEQPASIHLEQNYPNPFNPETQIRFELNAAASVTLAVYDASGRTIRVLVSSTMPAGAHSVTWDGNASDGQPAPSGTYLYRLETPTHTQSRSMTLLR